MEIVKGIESIYKSYDNPVITLGNFDGVHVGHQKIFKSVRTLAEKIGGTSIVVTFDPHPIKITNPQKDIKLLTPFEVKAELIEKSGMDVLLCITFSREFMSMSPEHFIEDIMVNRLHAAHVLVGQGFRFGKGKKGTTDVFKDAARRFGFLFSEINNVTREGADVSSSRIRALVTRGEVCEASKLLGRPYLIEGTVIKGKGRGASILGTPTANISTPNEVAPHTGVYVVKVMVDGSLFDGVANIGKNPTFGVNELGYEVHMFGYDGNLGGKLLRVYFIDRLRDERTFHGPEELKAQIDKDIQAAMSILKRRNRIKIKL